MTRTRGALRPYGLTHIALGVKDPERALAFYESVFGMVAVYRSDEFIQAQTPGARDVIVFERSTKSVGKERRHRALRLSPHETRGH